MTQFPCEPTLLKVIRTGRLHVREDKRANSLHPHDSDSNAVGILVTLGVQKASVFNNQKIFARIQVWMPPANFEGFLP
ncbi:hypothetical protein PHLH6_27690 [Pseudomonas sp. Seg1]|nr:hypothetical protein PHLH6_27690 [Pseudomonas sp. Seg1]